MEIYSIRIENGIVVNDCHVICEVRKVKRELKRLNKKYPNRNWIIGANVRLITFDGDNCNIGWYVSNML